MGISVTSSTEIPATVYERAKAHLRISTDTEADSVMLYLEQAVDDFERYSDRVLWNKTLKWTLDDFPSSSILYLPRAPVSSVSSVKYYDTAGTLQTFASSNYHVVTNDKQMGRIALLDTSDWPSTDEDRPEAVEITFVCGYGTGMADVPSMVLGGLILYAGHLFDNRTAQAAEDLEPIRTKLFWPYKARWVD